jgi:hypothetical protein
VPKGCNVIILINGVTFRWRDPTPVQSRRTVAMSSKGRWSIQYVAGEGPGEIKRPEGLLEFRAQLVARNFPGVVALQEQVGPIRYKDGKGRWTTTHIDIGLQLACGQRIGVSVKPEAISKTDEYLERMAHIRIGAVPEHFDDLVTVTERNIDPVALHNAELLHSCCDRDPEADEAVAQLVAAMQEPARILDIARPTGLGGRANRAAVRLIARRVLEPVRHERIQPTTLVRRISA